jgi:hypothetical protein
MNAQASMQLASPLSVYSGSQVHFPPNSQPYNQNSPWVDAIPTFSLTAPNGQMLSADRTFVHPMTGGLCRFTPTGVTCESRQARMLGTSAMSAEARQFGLMTEATSRAFV